MRLIDVLGALDADALESLAQRFKLPVDVRKRLDLAEQVARGLSAIPRKLRVEQGDDALHEAVRLLLAAPQGLPVRSLPRGTEAHAGHGLIFRDPAHPQRLVIPAAFRMLFAATPSDNPRAARVLLGSVPDDPRRELCVHHLKRLPPLPWPMLLETPLLRLEDPAWVRAELKALSETERQFLAAVDALGGEVNAEEVLELSREPMRLSVASGVQVPRRSPVFALARRGLMLTRHDGWVVPDAHGLTASANACSCPGICTTLPRCAARSQRRRDLRRLQPLRSSPARANCRRGDEQCPASPCGVLHRSFTSIRNAQSYSPALRAPMA